MPEYLVTKSKFPSINNSFPALSTGIIISSHPMGTETYSESTTPYINNSFPAHTKDINFSHPVGTGHILTIILFTLQVWKQRHILGSQLPPMSSHILKCVYFAIHYNRFVKEINIYHLFCFLTP